MLARNGAAPVGDLRYLADVRLSDVATPIAKAQVAAALAMVGDKERADNVYLAALNAISLQPKLDLGRADFGSALRDAAALVTLASEGKAPQKTIDDAVLRTQRARGIDEQHVSPGRYVLPQAKVEDMYRPDRFGRTATGTIEITPR